MKLPITDLTNNLMFTSSGTVWATWRIDGQAYGHAPTKKKFLIKKLHEEFLQSLSGEVLLSGITANVDPASVAEAMLKGLEMEDVPRWCEEVGETLDQLENMELGVRTYWLSVPLKMSDPKDAFKRHLATGLSFISERLGLPRMAPHPELVEASFRSAQRVQGVLPSALKARPATPAEIVWLALHHQQRGLSLDDLTPGDGVDGTLGSEQSTSSYRVIDPFLDAGAQTDDPEVNTDRIFERRYLKVAANDEPSYQCLQVVSAMPTGGFRFPGGEWMAAIDQMPFAVDWVWRMRITSARAAKQENAKNESRLSDQYNQRTDTGITGSQSELDIHAQDLHQFQQDLGRSEREVKVQVTPIFVVAAPSAFEVRERAKQLKEFFTSMEVALYAPLPALQEELWWSMQIGVPALPLMREFEHETTSYHLAGAIPLASNRLGAEKGLLLGFNITGGVPAAVLADIEGTLMGDRSGSFAICAELGAGKTATVKTITGHIVDRGARFVAIDRSSTREWEFFGKSITDCVTVDVTAPEYSLDPLRVFGPEIGASHVESLVAMLMNIAPADDLGITLNEVLNPEYLAERGLDNLPDVITHLREGCELPEAVELGRKMAAFASRSLGKVFFDRSLPALPIDARGIVFCTYELSLPTSDELQNEHLFRHLSIEKIFGRALYATIAKLAHRVCFADRSDLALFLASEAHHLTSNPQGLEIVNEFLREGRKAKAAIGMDSHDPEEFGPKRGLIPMRLLMRQPDPELAVKGLHWLGLDEKDEELIETITGLSPMDSDNKVFPGREGEGMLQDSAGNIGLLQVALPNVEERRAAVLTTPEEHHGKKVVA